MGRLRYKDTISAYTVTGSYNLEGEWIEIDDPIPTEVICNVQPMTKNSDRKNLPEGLETSQGWMVRVALDQPEIVVTDPLSNTIGDEVIIDGFKCEAVYMEYWRHLRLAHRKYLVVRKQVEINSG
jgi:hypothetical protein